jgi:hypothetical protein
VQDVTELEQLVETLDGLRASVLTKLAGLSEADARRSTVESGTNVAGLVQHLTFVESLWIEEVVAGGKASRGKRSTRRRPLPATARPTTSAGPSWPSSTKPRATPATPTSSANNSTEPPAADPTL